MLLSISRSEDEDRAGCNLLLLSVSAEESLDPPDDRGFFCCVISDEDGGGFSTFAEARSRNPSFWVAKTKLLECRLIC